jgi:hypothetical protein
MLLNGGLKPGCFNRSIESKSNWRIMLPLLVLSSLLGAVASPAMAVDSCTTLPSWTVSDFKSNSTDTVGAGGSASFTLTNNLTGTSDELSCNLQVNYRCIISGTPSDKNLTVHVAVRAGSLTFLLDEVVECSGRET